MSGLGYVSLTTFPWGHYLDLFCLPSRCWMGLQQWRKRRRRKRKKGQVGRVSYPPFSLVHRFEYPHHVHAALLFLTFNPSLPSLRSFFCLCRRWLQTPQPLPATAADAAHSQW